MLQERDWISMVLLLITVQLNLSEHILVETHQRHSTLIPKQGHLLRDPLCHIEDLALDSLREHLFLFDLALDLERVV